MERIILPDQVQQFALSLYQGLYPGDSPFSHGTSLPDLMTATNRADLSGRYVTANDIMNALNQGEYVIIGEHNLLRLGESHFLLFLPGRGDNPGGIHCIDSDRAIDSDPDVWPLEAVISAGESLFGRGEAIGIAVQIPAGGAIQSGTPNQ